MSGCSTRSTAKDYRVAWTDVWPMSLQVAEETGAELSGELRHDCSHTQPASTTGKRLIACSFLASLCVQPHTPLSRTSPALAFPALAAPAPPRLKPFLEATDHSGTNCPGIIVWGNLSAEPPKPSKGHLDLHIPRPCCSP